MHQPRRRGAATASDERRRRLQRGVPGRRAHPRRRAARRRRRGLGRRQLDARPRAVQHAADPRARRGAIAPAVRAWQARADTTSTDALRREGRADAPLGRRARCSACSRPVRRTLRAAAGGGGPEGSLGKLATSVVGPPPRRVPPRRCSAPRRCSSTATTATSRDAPRRAARGAVSLQRSFVGSPGHVDRRGHRRDPAQHHRRPGARPAPRAGRRQGRALERTLRN